jgi:hypothetical protein
MTHLEPMLELSTWTGHSTTKIQYPQIRPKRLQKPTVFDSAIFSSLLKPWALESLSIKQYKTLKKFKIVARNNRGQLRQLSKFSLSRSERNRVHQSQHV